MNRIFGFLFFLLISLSQFVGATTPLADLKESEPLLTAQRVDLLNLSESSKMSTLVAEEELLTAEDSLQIKLRLHEQTEKLFSKGVLTQEEYELSKLILDELRWKIEELKASHLEAKTQDSIWLSRITLSSDLKTLADKLLILYTELWRIKETRMRALEERANVNLLHHERWYLIAERSYSKKAISLRELILKEEDLKRSKRFFELAKSLHTTSQSTLAKFIEETKKK